VTTFADIKRVCDSVNNKVERGGPDGKSGNIIFVWDELQPNFNGQPYCAGGVSWVWKHAGHPFPAIDHPWGFSYTPDGVSWAKSHKLWLPNRPGVRFSPGDTILFDWPKNGHADHTGIVIQDMGEWILTFEFNTSPGNAGSQRNGGGCYYRKRHKDATVMGVLQSSKWLVQPGAAKPAAAAPKPAAKTLKANPYKTPVLSKARPVLRLGGNMTSAEVKFVQWACGAVKQDGVWGPKTDGIVKTFQKYHGLAPDGEVGPQTLTAMQRVTR
jgi:hypothetical protein